MKLSRLTTGALAALLSLTSIGFAPARAVAPVAHPSATTVTGACYGGPGKVSFEVIPRSAAEQYEVEVTARGLDEGSRWLIDLDLETSAGGGSRDYRREAVNGGWSIRARFAAPDSDADEVVVYLSAYARGSASHACFLLNIPTSPVAAGVSTCNNPRRSVALTARELADGSTVVRPYVFEVRRDSRWHLRLTATGSGSRQVVDFDASARKGAVTSRVTLTGVENPRLKLIASSRTGGTCRMGFNPPDVASGASLMPRDLAKLGLPRT